MNIPDRTVARYLRYPDTTGRRQAEGGRRMRGETRTSREGAPLVTIITVCWNSAKTIEQTFRSVRDQTYANIEYVVVDGGSTDGTVDLLRTHEDLIDYYVSEPDKGIYDAMNKGLGLAQGELIVLLNSDDWFEPEAVATLVAARQDSGCDFTCGLARYIQGGGNTSILPLMSYDKSVLLRMPLRHETMLIPATWYDRIGPYDTSYPIIADFEIAIRLYQAGATCYQVREALLNFRTTGVSSTALARLHLEHRRLLQKVFPFISDENAAQIENHSIATPDDFISVALAYPDQLDFFLAARSMTRDFGQIWGGHWAKGKAAFDAAAETLRLPEISVIVPVYNAEETIEDALRDVLNQSFTNIEVICVDDCSTDGSAALIKAIALADSRVRLMNNTMNLGPGGSRNAGIRAALGEYVFFLDADDQVLEGALQKLHDVAVAERSDVVRGAFQVDRRIHGSAMKMIKHPGNVSDRIVASTTLAEMPELLLTSEGHWACLYSRDFAETVLYPEGMNMGEDSLFLINALVEARSISIIPEPVYLYKDSSSSAMNNFSFDKHMDEITWRARAWARLTRAGLRERADYFLFDYWSLDTLHALDSMASREQAAAFYTALFDTFERAGSPDAGKCTSPELRNFFTQQAYSHGVKGVRKPLQLAILTTADHGGAGLASQRCMTALRDQGVEAFSICLFKNTGNANVFIAPMEGAAAAAHERGDETAVRLEWDRIAVVHHDDSPASVARELFSRNRGIVDTRALGQELQKVDVVHLHWIAGFADYKRLPEMLGDRRVVWTLHDMNPFTGGCHYSEGCEGFKDECRNCPLLETGSTLAHEAWREKRDAYRQIRNLQIICPSQWLADHVTASSLFKGRKVHVVPNFFPAGAFKPTNKHVARLKLGLELDKKYIVFGADSLENQRKGGRFLADSLSKLQAQGLTDDVEGLFFGQAHMELCVPHHNMGFVSDPVRLSLIYAAADVFAFPSLEDNAPQTVVESLLSGTPVVSFPVGNVSELVKHMETGYIAEYADLDSFAEGLAWALGNAGAPGTLLRNLRAHIDADAYHNTERTAALHRDVFLCKPEVAPAVRHDPFK